MTVRAIDAVLGQPWAIQPDWLHMISAIAQRQFDAPVVTAMRGNTLPPHPKPPAGAEPSMRVEVPSERLTAQWNLGRGICSGTARRTRRTGGFGSTTILMGSWARRLT